MYSTVAAAGGWKGTATLLECYQQPDTATLREVMSAPRKLCETQPEVQNAAAS